MWETLETTVTVTGGGGYLCAWWQCITSPEVRLSMFVTVWSSPTATQLMQSIQAVLLLRWFLSWGRRGGGYSLPLVWQPTLSSHLTLQLVQRLQSGNGRLLGGFILPGLRVGARLRAVGVFSGGLPAVVFKLGGGVRGWEQPSSQSGIPVSLLVSRVSPRRGWEKFHLRFSQLSRLKIIKLTLKICYNPL